MKFVSLFAGIGGLDLGLERAGHECVGQVEIEDYPYQVLEKHWPDIPKIRDVRDFQGHEFGGFDLLVGGYPCQPFSVAGNRKGDTDERHLWPEVHRIIRAVRPKYVLLENVPGHLSLGFGRVLGDLAESGYDAEWDCIPAAAVGAPHRRDRVFILAYPQGEHGNGSNYYARKCLERRSIPESGNGSGAENVAHTNGESSSSDQRPSQFQRAVLDEGGWQETPDGLETSSNWEGGTEDFRSFRATTGKDQWEVEPNVGRMVDGVPNGVGRLRGLGNAVVPQVAQWIGERLRAEETRESQA